MIGLYFALAGRKRHKGKDAALWMLRPTELNKHANIEDVKYPNYIPSFQDEEPKPYTIEYLKGGPNSSLLPIAVLAVRNNTRIQAQSGVFTIHHLKEDAIEDVGDGKQAIKLVIPKDKKDILAEQLETLGLNRFHVFPELSTIGEIIRGRYI